MDRGALEGTAQQEDWFTAFLRHGRGRREEGAKGKDGQQEQGEP